MLPVNRITAFAVLGVLASKKGCPIFKQKCVNQVLPEGVKTFTETGE